MRKRTARGVVKFWKSEKGWGAISSDALPEGQDAFCHFSAVVMDGFVELQAGQPVEFTWIEQQQASFGFVVEQARPL